jgi:hypothetical protein
MERPEGIEPFDSFHLFNVARLEVLWWNRAYKIKNLLIRAGYLWRSRNKSNDLPLLH